jgi:predicted N-acetyltransferase YhbS
MQIEIRNLFPSDIPTANAIVCSAFNSLESRAREIRRYLALQPDGWLLASNGDYPIGMVGAVDYGPFAWVGFMAVLPEYQHQGVGYQLMSHLLSWLDLRRCPMVRLDASVAGAYLYPKLGFVGDGNALIFTRYGSSRSGILPNGIYCIQEADIPEVVSIDKSVFGARRENLILSYIHDFPERSFVSRSESGQVTGYLIAQEAKIGPWISIQDESAELLLKAALSLPNMDNLRLIVPSENLAAAELLKRYSFSVGDPHLHMRRGGGRLPGRRSLIYAQASFAVG